VGGRPHKLEVHEVKIQIPRSGQRFVLVVRPLDWYAGSVGVGAVVEEASEQAIYVLFDGGLRESFPPARFAEYFSREEATQVSKNAPAASAARTGSGRILHR
jgi:hypothetical protein